MLATLCNILALYHKGMVLFIFNKTIRPLKKPFKDVLRAFYVLCIIISNTNKTPLDVLIIVYSYVVAFSYKENQKEYYGNQHKKVDSWSMDHKSKAGKTRKN